MKAEESEIRRKRRVLEHAVESGNVAKTCRYFGVRSRLPNRIRIQRRMRLSKRYCIYGRNITSAQFGSCGTWRATIRCASPKTARYQYTAIDDATRVRALKIYTRHTRKNAIAFVDHIVTKFPFRIQQIRTDRGHEFQAQFHWHVEDRGIRHAYIKPRTPHESLREKLT